MTESDEQLKKLKEFRAGKLICRVFETVSGGGEVLKTFFTLGRDDKQQPFIGGLNDLARTRGLLSQVEKELGHKLPGKRYLAVQAVRLVEGGTVFRVEESFVKEWKAEQLAMRTKHLVAITRTTAVEPKKGDEILIRDGELKEDTRLKYQVDRLKWLKELAARDYTFGRWGDSRVRPDVGDLVNIEPQHHYRGKPLDHRILPLSPSTKPGEPKEALYAVIEVDKSVIGLGRIVSLTRVRVDAVNTTNEKQVELDAERAKLVAQQAEKAREFREFDASPELRPIAKEPHAEAPATTPPRQEPKTITVGSLRAEVFGPEDKRTVRITKGGQSIEFGLDELLAVAREVEGLEKAKGQVKGRLHEAAAEKDGQMAARPEKGRGPEPLPAAGRNHPEWVLGVWYGVEPPRLDQPLWFMRGAERVEERVMTPVQGEVKAPEPGQSPHYVLARVVGDGLALAHGSTRDLQYMLGRTAKFQEAARTQAVQQTNEPQRRHRERENGLSMGL